MKQKYRDIYYANGEKDAAKGWGSYDPPNGVIHAAVDSDAAEANDLYRDGYRNAAEQRPK